MKKIFFGLCCMLALVSCEQSTNQLCGRWHKSEEALGGYGSYKFSITFHGNGTYDTKAENKSADQASWTTIKTSGKYRYIGEDEGTLYLYDRVEDGIVFEEEVRYSVTIRGNHLYLSNECSVNEYLK